MKIDKPTEYQKNMAIEKIMQKGLVRPRKLSAQLLEMWRTLGLSYIFGDIFQAFIIVAIIMLGGFLVYLEFSKLMMHAVTFAFAPLSFLSIVLFAEMIERLSGLYELKMTFKYTIRQITAFRILCFSLLGVVTCVISSASAGGEFLQTLATSLSALFLCALFITFILRRFAPVWRYVSMGAWVIISVLPIYLLGERWETILSGMPAALTLTIAVIAFLLFLHEVKQIMNEKRGAEIYAGC